MLLVTLSLWSGRQSLYDLDPTLYLYQAAKVRVVSFTADSIYFICFFTR